MWIKIGTKSDYNVFKELSDVCELLRCLLLYNINKIIDTSNDGLYSDNGLIILNSEKVECNT